ncbi:flagellar biosynthetic protein FliR [Orenia marismortui]|uniref:Flagellar biosynthetic protein FliR n=1 Tax=Orenia marismortui TaxID=46469 RepID=A0A4R8GZ52_9FIRM|nr:flagellar biosynthetic protein FliR [Orenia marismortui]TDX51916.1 flagellar biosynthetic protein FliR [Orenia marismortui]
MQDELLVQIYNFSLILSRILGFLLIAPIFGSKSLPNRFKLALAFLITILLFPLVADQNIQFPNQLLIILFRIVVELLIGFIIGFIMLLNFIAIQLAGQFIDTRMGFAMANVMDPQNGMKAPLVGQFQNILATLVFLSINAHHHLLKVLSDSFTIVEITKFQSSKDLIPSLFRIIGNLLPLGFKLALPIIAILFIVDLAFGLVARVVPQINVFMMGLPTKTFVGLLFLSLIMPSYINHLQLIFSDAVEDIYQILKLMIERG